MTDVPTTREAILALLKGHGITTEQVHAQAADLAATTGGLTLHADPDRSDVAPLEATVRDPDDLAALLGRPAEEAGDATSYPTTVPVFVGGDHRVTADQPLVLGGTSSPVVAVFDALAIEAGGQLRWGPAGGSLTADTLTAPGPDSADPSDTNLVSRGADGPNGRAGVPGRGGMAGPAGTPGQDDGSTCQLPATAGGTGGPGGEGGPGAAGGAGENAQPVTLVVGTLNGHMVVGSIGGAGGAGGAGGGGGDGGPGGAGGAATTHCAAGAGGQGGRGGSGGSGGSGGDGGNGARVSITYQAGDPTFEVVQGAGIGGPGGPGGSGGLGGPGGASDGDGGPAGPAGTAGTAGRPGRPGTVFVNGRQLP